MNKSVCSESSIKIDIALSAKFLLNFDPVIFILSEYRFTPPFEDG